MAPPVTRELIRYLQQVFPNRLPLNTITITDRALGAKFGEQAVIEHLAAVLRNQEDELLNVSP